MRELFQPGVARETADLLNRAVDRLDHPRSAHDNATCSVRKVPNTLSLAVLRIDVDHGLAKGFRRKSERVEPVLLDLDLLLEMVGIEVTRDPYLGAAQAEVRPQKVDEEPGHHGIRIRKLQLVALLRALGPVEHATRHEAGSRRRARRRPSSWN